MNINEDSTKKVDELGDALNEEKDENSSADEYISNRLEKYKTQIRNERFLFFLILIVVFNSVVFTFFENWGAPISITVIEILVIAYGGRLYDIKEIELITDKILSVFSKKDESK